MIFFVSLSYYGVIVTSFENLNVSKVLYMEIKNNNNEKEY